MPWLIVIQVALIIAWFAVPAFAVIPAWAIFLPIIIPAAVLAIFGLIFVIGAIALALSGR